MAKHFNSKVLANGKPLNRMNDVFAKFIFANEARKDLTLDLINSVFELDGTKEIVDFDFRDRELDPDREDGRGIVLDVTGRCSDGTLVNVEIQLHKLDGMEQRMPIKEIEKIVDEVRGVGRLVADMLDTFTAEEITNATRASRELRMIVYIAVATEALLLLIAFRRTRSETRKLTESIHTSIYSLEETVRRIAEGNFGARIIERRYCCTRLLDQPGSLSSPRSSRSIPAFVTS